MNKTLSRITSDEEMNIYNRIINIQEIKEGQPILTELSKFNNIFFKSATLLLLKCKLYDIEDKHYLETKIHNKEERDCLKKYKKLRFPKIKPGD